MRGEFRAASLGRSDVQIHFGCSRGHLFGDDPSDTDLIPCEVSWRNEEKPGVYSDGCVDEGEMGTRNARVHRD